MFYFPPSTHLDQSAFVESLFHVVFWAFWIIAEFRCDEDHVGPDIQVNFQGLRLRSAVFFSAIIRDYKRLQVDTPALPHRCQDLLRILSSPFTPLLPGAQSPAD